MADFDNTNRGVLFKNDKKESDKHPDYTGTINVHGQEFRLAAWIRDAKSGTKYMSLSVSEFQEPVSTEAKAKLDNRDLGEEPISLDDIPF